MLDQNSLFAGISQQELPSNLQSAIEAIRDMISREIPDDTESRTAFINGLRRMISEFSPFRDDPVDCVLWVPQDSVGANDYNPNAVAPPEMKLLEHSILCDGYTQPIVTWKPEGSNGYEVVDGFHRNRVGKECASVRERVKGHLPITVVKPDRTERNDRIAATIRHNRARGKHRIDGMSDIVVELRRRNWSPKKIGKELGMDMDEVLRLTQITGLAEMFSDKDFSEAWAADTLEDDDFNKEDNEEDLSSVLGVGGNGKPDVALGEESR